MPLVSWTNWDNNSGVPLSPYTNSAEYGWDMSLYTLRAVDFGQNRLYGLISGQRNFDQVFDPIVPPAPVFGYAIYDVTNEAATFLSWKDLNAEIPDFIPNYDRVYHWQVLQDSFGGTGKTLLVMNHSTGFSDTVTYKIMTTIIDAAAGTVLATQEMTSETYLSYGYEGWAFMSPIIAPIGSVGSAVNWYVIARNLNLALNVGKEHFTITGIAWNSGSPTITEHVVNTSLGTGISDFLSQQCTFRVASDGVDFWTCDRFNYTTNPQVYYLKWPFPWTGMPTITGVVTLTGINNGIRDVIYFKDDLNTERILVSYRQEVADNFAKMKGLSFTTALGTYTEDWSVSAPAAYGIGFFQSWWSKGGFTFGNTDAMCWYPNLYGVMLGFLTTGSALAGTGMICVDDGTFTDYVSIDSGWQEWGFIDSRNHRVHGFYENVLGDFHTIEGRSKTIDMSPCGGEPPGGGGGDDNFYAALFQSFGQFTSVIRAIAEQPCPVVGSTSYGVCLTGRSSWPPGVGQVLCGRDDVALPCD